MTRAETILRANNLKVTRQREMILDIILSSKTRLTAADIHQRLSDLGSEYGLCTVYRTLSSLEESKVVKKTEMPGDDSGFYSSATGHRHCFVCTDCKREFEIDFCPVDLRSDELAKKMGFTVTGHSFEIFGVCSECGGRRKKD